MLGLPKLDNADSLQVCREFLVVLTRQPVSGRSFTLAESVAALEVWLTGCQVLDETVNVLHECLRLVQQFEVHGKQVMIHLTDPQQHGLEKSGSCRS